MGKLLINNKLINFILIITFLLTTEIYIKYKINYENDSAIIGQYENLNINNNIKFSEDNITIVTGYQRTKSKHRFSLYNEWIANLLKINKSLIFFIDKSIAKKVINQRPKEYLNKTIWILLDIKEFYSFKNFLNEFNFISYF